MKGQHSQRRQRTSETLWELVLRGRCLQPSPGSGHCLHFCSEPHLPSLTDDIRLTGAEQQTEVCVTNVTLNVWVSL